MVFSASMDFTASITPCRLRLAFRQTKNNTVAILPSNTGNKNNDHNKRDKSILSVAGCDSNNCPSKMPGSFTLPNKWATKLSNSIPPTKPKKTFAHGYATVVSAVGLRLNISLSLNQNTLKEKAMPTGQKRPSTSPDDFSYHPAAAPPTRARQVAGRGVGENVMRHAVFLCGGCTDDSANPPGWLSIAPSPPGLQFPGKRQQ